MTKEFYNNAYQPDHPSQYAAAEGRTPALYHDTSTWLKSTKLAINKDAIILEIGCGMAFLSNIHPGWHGAEYSKTAVERVKTEQG